MTDPIDKMILNEVIRIRALTNRSREKLGLPPRDYSHLPIQDPALQEPISN